MVNENGIKYKISEISPLWKVAGLTVMISSAISGTAMSVLSDRITAQSKMLSGISIEVSKGERYTEKDAERDFTVANRRMSRIENRDDRCERRMNEHIQNH
jgi:hypothetical protein